MIKEILHKHAAIGLNNGSVIEGFVQDSDETYFRMVEWDNNVAIVRIDDISFARLANNVEQSTRQPRQQTAAYQAPSVQQPQQQVEMPPIATSRGMQLDEEGFAIGLPRGVVTTECPAQVPISGADDGPYELPFPRGRR